MSKQLRIVAPFHNASGFASAGRALLAAALYAGYEVEAVEAEVNYVRTRYVGNRYGDAIVPMFAGSIELLPDEQRAELETALATKVDQSAPTLLLLNPSGLSGGADYCRGPRIGLTMLESDTVCPSWARGARNVDLLLTPSRFCQDAFRAAGLDAGLFPLCVDERLWKPVGPPAPNNRGEGEREELFGEGCPSTLFFSLFSTCERKGWRVLLQAFAEEFRGEDVGLFCKVTRGAEVAELAGWCRSMGAWVEVSDEPCTIERLGEAYRACDVFALPSCEGFGLPIVEAAYCGKPSLALAAGGVADLVNAESGYPVPAKMTRAIGQLPQVYPSEHRFATCKIGDLRRALRTAYEDTYRPHKGVEAERQMRALCSRSAVAARLEDVVGRVQGSGFRVQVGPTDSPPPVACIVTTHNHLERTRACVEALRAHTPGVEIVLADDGSTDGTQEWAFREAVDVVECGGGNVSLNRQMATQLVRERWRQRERPARYVVYLDNDVEVGPGWWQGLAAMFEAHPRIGALAPLKRLGSGDVQNCGNRMYAHGGTIPMMLALPVVWPDYIESACMAVRPRALDDFEWDPQFPIFYEDADVCFQLRAAGWEIAATATVEVTHHAHTSSTPRAAESETNRRRFLVKWKGAI